MNKLKKDEIILKDEEQKILNSKNLLSKEEFNNKVRNFQKKVNLYNELKEENKIVSSPHKNLMCY